MTQTEVPRLHEPVLVAAFEGWNDAGDAATGAVEHLELCWDTSPLAEIDSEDYYDFQVTRPTVTMVDGVTRSIQWPATRLSVCRPPGSDRDVVLVRGIEPNMRWRSFCAELVDWVQRLDVTTVITLGALLADTAHTRPTPVTGSAPDPETAKRLGVEQTRYEGPTGITGVLQDACVRAGVPALSFWAAVPHYVSTPPNPKATLALLHRVEEVLDVEVPLIGLPEQAQEWEETVNEMAADDEDVVGYVRTLEERGDAETAMSEAVAKTDAESIAAEFERYLRRRGPGPEGPQGA